MDHDKLNDRLTSLEGQVSRLLVALCCALGVILVLIFYQRAPFSFDQDVGDAFVRMIGAVASSVVVGWPIVRWVVGKKSE
ncbi:hypothetical protein ACVW16_001257 [Bradyrhizobium sp. USDA 4474]